jgi:hypothetical protein
MASCIPPLKFQEWLEEFFIDFFPFHDYIVGVFDGIETYSSYNIKCDRCLSRVVETKKGNKIQYYHRAVVLTLVGYDFSIPIGLEMIRKGEDEVNCALRLLKPFQGIYPNIRIQL